MTSLVGIFEGNLVIRTLARWFYFMMNFIYETLSYFSYLFRSGHHNHPDDKFINTIVEIRPESGDMNNFIQVGDFNSAGIAMSELDPKYGKIAAIRLKVLQACANWVMLSEVSNFIFSFLMVTFVIYADRCIARQRPGSLGFNTIWASMRETLTLLLANNKGADQPMHPHSLICAFVICYLKK